jgi:hypothetical protein
MNTSVVCLALPNAVFELTVSPKHGLGVIGAQLNWDGNTQRDLHRDCQHNVRKHTVECSRVVHKRTYVVQATEDINAAGSRRMQIPAKESDGFLERDSLKGLG